jgi:hypothetical protein
MKLPTFAGVSPFSRRAAAVAAAKAKADGDEEEDKDKKTKKAEGDEEDSGDEESKKSKKAEGDEDESDEDKKKSKKAEGDEEDDESEDDKKKSKKSKKAEGDEEDDEKDEPEARVSAADVARIRAGERKRISAIVSSEAGLANPDAAYELAVNSDMPTANAIAMLRAVGPAKAQAPAKDNLRDRMANTKQPDIGAGGDEAPAPGDPKALAAAIINAGKKRRGEAA